MRRFPTCLAFILIFFASSASAASLDTQNYRRAFAAIDAGHADLAMSVAEHAHDVVLNKVIRGCYLGSPGNAASFAETAEFIADNPVWPGQRDILTMAEQKIPTTADPLEVINWFGTHPPISLVGFYRYIDALNAAGESNDALGAMKKRWIDGDFTMDELTAFYARFGSLLSHDDIWARLDRLLWNSDGVGARRLYGIVPSEMKLDAEARLALASEGSNADELYQQATSAGFNDPGLVYERLRWLRHQDRDDEATDLLAHAPTDLLHPKAWWNEREIIVHRLMDKHDYNLAYSLAADHGLSEGKDFIEGEFLAGWLSLRFLNDPATARGHFETIYNNAATPLGRSRGAYWLGRTLETMGDINGAAPFYAAAADYDTTYYGQLALARLSTQPTITAQKEPEPDPAARARFDANDLVHAAEHLHELGEKERARSFFRAALGVAANRDDFVLLTELANHMGRPDLAIEAAKTATLKNAPVEANGFPILSHHVPTPPEAAFTEALIRQESMFNPEAESAVGAVGLMQLMPHTAQAVARQTGVKFRESRLGEVDYNLRLGTAFVQKQIDHYDGSYILALASYNAGPGRVHEWLERIGDPRDPAIDPIDWIEMIPVAETRNYVQRILESLQIYRARLNGGHAPLMILQDLKR
jgi:soluble lytic murein transglycosylase